MIKVTNLNKYYNKGKDNELHVINDVNLTLPETGLVSFLGQSGSGKTTLLNVIGGLDKGVGTINYDNLEIKNYKVKQIDAFRRKTIGYVFQNYNLLLTETVYDNLRIALELIDIYDKEEQEKRIEYVLKMVGMYKYRKKKAYALSGGQQQRISIARALVKNAKIIIADEPTGNLDSENSIQVMNILKKISEKTLVLMVTHNEDLAKFYSDIIYKVKDGKVSEGALSTEGVTLNKRSDNVVYLKDKEENETCNDLFNIKYYSDNGPKKLDLSIIEHNGVFYIKGDNIKLLESSNLILKDAHYEELKQEEVASFDYDTSFFKDEKGKKNIFKQIGLNFKESFNNIMNVKRKTKFLYISFFIIGILFAISVCAFSNFTVIDTKNFEVDENYQTIAKDDYYSSNEEALTINDLLTKDLINNINRVLFADAKFEKKLNFNEEISIESTFPMISSIDTKTKIYKGTNPNKGEIVLSKGLAKRIVDNSKNYFKSIDELLNVSFNIEIPSMNIYRTLKVSGINENQYIMSYINDLDYLPMIADARQTSFDPSPLFRSFDIESKYHTYEIVKGRDLNIDDYNSNNILIPVDYENSQNLVGSEIDISSNTYKIVGVYKINGLTNTNNEFIINSDSSIPQVNTSFDKSIYEYSEFKLVDGKNPSKNNEVITSIYTDLNINDEIYGYKVVGKFVPTKQTVSSILLSRDAFVATNSIYNKCLFDVIDSDKIKENLKDKFSITNQYENLYHQTKAEQNMSLAIFGSFSIILLIILVVFIYFLMRSRMISEIYPIGVYRSLGASKGKIYSKFASDIFITTSLTSTLGYVIFMILYGTIANTANSYMGGMVLMNSIPMTLIGILLLYVISFIFGLLPINFLMKKTPAEIIAKYDI